MDKGTETMIENLHKNTGKTLPQWIDLVKKENFIKHGESGIILHMVLQI